MNRIAAPSRHRWVYTLPCVVSIVCSVSAAPGIAGGEQDDDVNLEKMLLSIDKSFLTRVLETAATDREKVQALGLACYLVPDSASVKAEDSIRLHILLRNTGSDRVELSDFSPLLDFITIVVPDADRSIRRTALGERLLKKPTSGSAHLISIPAGQNRVYSFDLRKLFIFEKGRYTIWVLRFMKVASKPGEGFLLASNKISIEVSENQTTKMGEHESSPGGANTNARPSDGDRMRQLPPAYRAAAKAVELSEEQKIQVAASYQQYRDAERQAADRAKAENKRFWAVKSRGDEEAMSRAKAKLDEVLAHQRSIPGELRKSIWAVLNKDQVVPWEQTMLASILGKVFERVGLTKEQQAEIDKLIAEAAEKVVNADPTDYYTNTQIRVELQFSIRQDVLTEEQRQILESK